MRYIARKPMPGAKVGDILKRETYEGIPCLTQEVPVTCLLIGEHNIQDALDQGFIEPYEEKPKRFRTNIKGTYWSIGMNPEWQDSEQPNHIHAYKNIETGDKWDECCYRGLNYFKSKETAEAVAEALKLFFEYLHTPRNIDKSSVGTWDKLDDEIEEARKLVLKDNEVSDE